MTEARQPVQGAQHHYHQRGERVLVREQGLHQRSSPRSSPGTGHRDAVSSSAADGGQIGPGPPAGGSGSSGSPPDGQADGEAG